MAGAARVSPVPTEPPTLSEYRRGEQTSEPLAFGIYGEVIEPGSVRLGDPVITESP